MADEERTIVGFYAWLDPDEPGIGWRVPVYADGSKGPRERVVHEIEGVEITHHVLDEASGWRDVGYTTGEGEVPLTLGQGGPEIGTARIKDGIVTADVTDPEVRRKIQETIGSDYSIAPMHPNVAADLRAAMTKPTPNLPPLIESMTRITAELGRVIAPISKAMQEFGKALHQPDEVEPVDPRERALWLRKHRNTGPKGGPRGRR